MMIFCISMICLMFNIQISQSTSSKKFWQLDYETHEGDILVNDSQTFTIKNCMFVQYGKITVSNNATLQVENAILIIKNLLMPFGIGLKVIDNANLSLINATLVLANGAKEHLSHQVIEIEKNATAVVSSSNITSPYRNAWMVAQFNSEVIINNSIFDNSTGLGILDDSKGHIRDSILTSQLNVARNSNLTVEDSDINQIHGSDCSDIQIKNCVIHSYSEATWGTNMHVYNSSISSPFTFNDATAIFEDSSLDKLMANDHASVKLIRSSASGIHADLGSTVWLINSNGGVITAGDKSNVFVGYDLPLFGVMTIPYTWVPIIQTFFILMLFLIFIAVLVKVKKHFSKTSDLSQNQKFL